MTTPLVVSTECPTCGAPLDFSEGSNAVRCGHCGSALLATGRKQVLSYVIRPRVDAAGAAGVVKFAISDSATRTAVTQVGLHLVPYYRFRGEDLRWERGVAEREPLDLAMLSTLGVDGRELGLAIHEDEPEPVVTLRERRIEKNFLGCALPGLPLYSLGVRPAVLKLELFDRAALPADATIVAAEMDAEAALAHGLLTDDRDKLLHREVIGRVLSLVYFPFWIVVVERAGARRVAIVDGVTEALVVRDADPSVLATLDLAETGSPRTVGFRPLTCPNCGWELPLEPDDVIFPCGACPRVWLLEGDRLSDVPYSVARPPNGAARVTRPDRSTPARGSSVRPSAVASTLSEAAAHATRAASLHHLPIWTVDGASGRFFVPAFRYRRLALVHDLARNLTRVAPEIEQDSGERPSLHAAYIDEHDAGALADLVRAGVTAENGELREQAPLAVERARLAWLPFESDGYSLREPFSGTSIPENLLL